MFSILLLCSYIKRGLSHPREPRVLIVRNSRYLKETFIRKNDMPMEGRIGMQVIEATSWKLLPFIQVLQS